MEEPPKCEFYKELEFLNTIITDGKDDVMKYPDVPDIRFIFNEIKYCIFPEETFSTNSYRCSCSSGNNSENNKQKIYEINEIVSDPLDATSESSKIHS